MRTQAGERLILLSASTAARQRDRCREIERLCRQADWQGLAGSLEGRGLLPALGPRVQTLGGAAVPEAFVARLELALGESRRRAHVLQLNEMHVVSALEREGIPSASLKGPALAERAYGDAGRRTCGDIDLLLAPAHLHAAAGILANLGYELPSDALDADGLPRIHLTMRPTGGTLAPVDLHWRIHWYEGRFAQERLFDPEPEDELAALLLFYARNGFADLRLAADIAAWWERRGEQLPREGLRALSGGYPPLSRALGAAAHAAERTVGLPAARVLGDAERLGPRGRLAVALARPHPQGSASQLYAEMGLIDGLLSPPRSLGAFLRRQLVPSRTVLDERAGRRSSSRLAYLLRALVRSGVLARYLIALARVAVARSAPQSAAGA